MSLETEIKNLRTSIDKLVEVLSSLPAQPTSSSSSPAAAASSSAAANQAAPAPSTQQAAEPADAQTFDYQKDIKPRVLKLGETNMNALLELFKEFGVSKAPELKAEQYESFAARIDSLIAGGGQQAQQTESLV
ncbi:MAG TPA: hypothetical protein VF161_07520 [Steroidobacteraceae bacterium]